MLLFSALNTVHSSVPALGKVGEVLQTREAFPMYKFATQLGSHVFWWGREVKILEVPEFQS